MFAGRFGRLLTGTSIAARRPPLGLLALTGGVAALVLLVGVLVISLMDSPGPGSAVAASHSNRPSQSIHTPRSAANQQTTKPQARTPTPTSGHPTSPATSAATRHPADHRHWRRVLQALDAMRSRAFSTLNLRDLDRIYLPGSPPWLADRDLLLAYRRQQVRVDGLRITIDHLTVVRSTPTAVTLRTTDHLIAGHLVNPSGQRTRLPPAPPTTRLITLTPTAPPTRPATPTQTATGWRISAITTPNSR